MSVFCAAGGKCVSGKAVAISEDEQLIFEGLLIYLPGGCEAVVFRQGCKKRFVEEDDFGNFWGVGFSSDQSGIKFVIAETVN